MKTIKNNPNSDTKPTPQELPKEATTITDASDRLPAFQTFDGVNVRAPDKMIHSEADCAAISTGHVTETSGKRQRGKGGVMSEVWN